jgi:predicted AAA+ superfamily ATPase
MNDVIREDYLQRISKFRDQDVIKILTGVRRCGKSTIMRQYIQRLLDEGIPEEDIVYVNMESLSNHRFEDGMALYEHILESRKKRRLYVFLDEVQMIRGWKRVVNSLKADMDCDIYLTGSNAYLLSTEISTLLTGRSVSFMILPLSFKEFLKIDPPEGLYDVPKKFSRYVRLGGMPFIRPGNDEDVVFQRLGEIKSDIILKDVCNRKEKIGSVKIRRMVDYMLSETGNPLSAENLANRLKISTSTAGGYLSLIMDSLLFYKAERFDIKGKDVLSTMPRIYCVDTGLRNTQPIAGDRDYGRVLENIVFLELLRRGFSVYVGKSGKYEIDFVTVKNGRHGYVQVSQTIVDEAVREKELRPLRTVTGNGDRLLVVADPMEKAEVDGVTVMNVIDFLMERSHQGPKGEKGSAPERPSYIQ